MPAATFELKQWLKGLGLADDVVTDLSTKLGDEKVASAIKSQVMAQSDYSRSMDELKKQEAKLQSDFDTKLKAEMDSIGTYRGEYDARYAKATKEREEAQKALVAARNAVERLANEYALPEDAVKSVFEGGVVLTDEQRRQQEQERARQQQTVDTSKFMTVENFGKEANAYARLMPTMLQMEREHSRLFGADQFPDFEKLLDRAAKEKIPLRAAWEAEYKVADKKEEVRKAAEDARVNDAVKAAETRIRSELALENPGVRTSTAQYPHSPALEAAGIPKATKDANGNDIPVYRRATASSSDDRVRNAVQKFHENLAAAQEKVA